MIVVGLLPQNRYARWILWAMLALILLVSFSCFFYEDIQTIYDNSAVFWHGLLQGRSPFEFYEYSVEYTRSPWAANYNFFSYIITTLWCLPSLVYCKLSGLDYFHSYVGRMWFKMLPLLALFLATYLIMQILGLLGKNKKTQVAAAFAFLSSILVVNSVLVISNLEIISLCFMLAGVLFLLRGKQAWFLAFFAMATACKSFALFLAIPLVLLMEKNVFKVVGKCASVMFIVLAEKIVFRGSAAYANALSANVDFAAEQLFETNLTRTALFIVAFIFIVVFCYAHRAPRIVRQEDGLTRVMATRDAWTVLYVCFLAFGVFVICVKQQDYWPVLVMPFLVLMTAREERLAPLMVAIETVGSFSYVLYLCFWRWSLNGDHGLLSRALLAKLSLLPPDGDLRHENVRAFLETTPLASFKDAYLSVFIACMVLMLILMAPVVADTIKEKVVFDSSLSLILPWVRIGICIVFLSMLFYARTAVIPKPIFSNLNETARPAEQNLIASDKRHTYAQTLALGDATSLDTLSMAFDNSHPDRINFAWVDIEIWDTTERTRIWTKTLPANTVEPGVQERLGLGSVAVDPSHQYELRLTGMHGTPYSVSVDATMRPFICGDQENAGLRVDDVPQNGVMQYEIR